MKRPILLVCGAALVAVVFAGCASPGRHCKGLIRGSCHKAPETCASCTSCNAPASVDPALVGKRAADPCRLCHGRGCHHCKHRMGRATDPGPAVGAITYPYYTVRGPRDFLAKNPPSIGP